MAAFTSTVWAYATGLAGAGRNSERGKVDSPGGLHPWLFFIPMEWSIRLAADHACRRPHALWHRVCVYKTRRMMPQSAHIILKNLTSNRAATYRIRSAVSFLTAITFI